MTDLRGLCLMLVTCVSLAGQTSQEELAKEKRAAEMIAKKRSAEAMQMLASDLGGSAIVVRDRPYSADAVTETVQELRDGNRIVRRNVLKLYRDRLGRTRREQTLETLGPSAPVEQKQIVLISDPVARVDYILDGGAVRRFSRPEPLVPLAGVDRAEQRNLGKRTIEGLECTGLQKTVTIHAGQIGNVRPIVTLTETWYAPALEAVVLSTTSDPRFGDTTYSLRNIQQADPPARLFETPVETKSK